MRYAIRVYCLVLRAAMGPLVPTHLQCHGLTRRAGCRGGRVFARRLEPGSTFRYAQVLCTRLRIRYVSQPQHNRVQATLKYMILLRKLERTALQRRHERSQRILKQA